MKGGKEWALVPLVLVLGMIGINQWHSAPELDEGLHAMDLDRLSGMEIGKQSKAAILEMLRSEQPETISRQAEINELQTALTAVQQGNPLLGLDVDVRTVATVIADWTGVPLSSLMKDEQTELLSLEDKPKLLSSILFSLILAIQEKMLTKDFSEWNELFSTQDVCVEPVLSLHEALHSALADERGWLVSVPVQEGSTKNEQQLACPIKFSRSKIRYEFIGKSLGYDLL